VWTLLSCTLCFLCAFNLGSRPIYAATFLSLVYAYGHFLVEYLLYRTVRPANLVGLGVFAGTSSDRWFVSYHLWSVLPVVL
jgi:hypothetical protein